MAHFEHLLSHVTFLISAVRDREGMICDKRILQVKPNGTQILSGVVLVVPLVTACLICPALRTPGRH